jgi:hypothetical protein
MVDYINVSGSSQEICHLTDGRQKTGNVKKMEHKGYCRWDFERVFTEHNGIGATITRKEIWIA